MPTLAVTGGTGFVGVHLLRIATEQGYAVRALTRRPQPDRSDVTWPQVTWITGALDDTDSLCRLCDGADAVVHLAGVIKARTRAEFEVGNIGGTRAMLEAADASGVRRFVHVSSLAAREPQLSTYAATKAGAEAAVRGSKLDWTIIRPPAVYGPGDRETLTFFRLVARGLALVPNAGRFSVIEVTDLARAILALVGAPASHGLTLEVDDGTPGALDHATLARLIGAAVDRQPRLIRLPAIALRLAAIGDMAAGRITGRVPQLTLEKARELAHADWVSDTGAMERLGVWQPTVPAPAGIMATAAWYRQQGWL